MSARVSFFPVDSGDMVLIEFDSGRKLLADINIREVDKDADNPIPDVLPMLKERLNKDSEGRPYVDAFLTSHPDKDHCLGFKAHFHAGAPGDYVKDSGKIFVHEIWSSPIAFRRASVNHTLCDDAKALNAEAKRRVARFRAVGSAVGDGDRILILGEDEDGKTNDLTAILVKADQQITRINGATDGTFTARLLAPVPKGEEGEEASKNDSSVVMQFALNGAGVSGACRYLTGGDAEVGVWEELWKRHESQPGWLEYDLLLTPHHCSWHSLSWDSWSECGEDAEVSLAARNSLSQARNGAKLVASSKPIKDDDDDPPCIRAKREYEDIAGDVDGEFLCTMEEVSTTDPAPLEFEVTATGVARVVTKKKAAAKVAPSVIVNPPKPWAR